MKEKLQKILLEQIEKLCEQMPTIENSMAIKELAVAIIDLEPLEQVNFEKS